MNDTCHIFLDINWLKYYKNINYISRSVGLQE